MRKSLISLVSLGAVLLCGCSTMEKRSEIVPKQKLAAVNNVLHFKSNWSNGVGSGIGGANITLSRYKNYLVTSDKDGVVTALDTNGKKVWQVKLNASVSAGPAVKQGMVVVATGDARVFALHISSGEIAWSTRVSSEVLATPTIANHTVYVHALDGRITALDLDNGAETWQYNYSVPNIILRKTSSVVALNDSLIVGLANGILVSLDKSGQLLWRADLSGYKSERSDLKQMADVAATPVISDDSIYAVGYQGLLSSVSIVSGQPSWEAQVSSFVGLTTGSKQLYVVDDIGNVAAYSKFTGQKIWKLEALKGRTLTTPVIKGNNLIVGDEDGNLHFINLISGKITNRYKVGGNGIATHPIIAGDTMYILTNSGKVSAVAVH